MNVTITISIPDSLVESTVKSIMENFPEASAGCAMMCTDYDYEGWHFEFHDGETGNKHTLDKAKLLGAFALLYSDKWPKGCTQPPASNNPEVWEDWLCQSDAQDADAFVQLAIFGEVIYG